MNTKSITGHAATTWLLAHGLHVIIVLAGGILLSPDLLELAGIIIIFAFLFSVPAIPVFWFAIRLIINSSMPSLGKLFTWVLVALFIVAMNAWLLVFGFTGSSYPEDTFMIALGFGSPSVAATFFAVLIRAQQFLELNKEVNTSL